MILRLSKIFHVLAILSFCGMPILSPSSAQSLSGRITTAFYSWEAPETVSNSASYFRGYQGIVLNVKNLGSPKVSLHTGIRVVEDYGTGIENNADHRIYNLYIRARQLGDAVDLKLGRQQIFSGVAFGTIDGLIATFRYPNVAYLEIFAGSLVPLRETWKVNGWNEGNMWGSRLVVNRWASTNVSVSYMQKSRKPLAYTEPGIYSGRLWNFDPLQQNLLGLDAEHTFTKSVKVYGRLEGDIENQKFDRAEGIVQYNPVQNFSLTGEFFFRKPRMHYNSIFNYFTQLDSKEWWLRGLYRFNGKWFVHGGIATVRYEGDESTNRYDFGLGSEYFSIGYNRRSGFSGALDGFYANGQYPVVKMVWARAGVFVSRYKLYEEFEEYDNLVTSFGGVKIIPRDWFNFDIEGQGLNNKLFSKDFRLFIRGNFWFFTK